MPAAHTDTSVHAPVTAQSRRRVWAHPDLTSHSLLVLTSDRLYLAPADASPDPELVAAAEAGADPDELLGPDATVLELSSIRRVKLDLLANELTIHSAGATGPNPLTLGFASPEAADACFTKLWRQLGDGCELLPYRRDWPALARGPVVLLGAVLAITAALALTLGVFDDYASARAVASFGDGPVPRSPLEALIGWMDWRVVCGAGGAVAAAVQVWFYRRLTSPPLSLEVVRAEL